MPEDTAVQILPVLSPNLQVSFYYRLQKLRSLYLHDALARTLQSLDISVLDDELAHYVGSDHLQKLASYSLRGEAIFPTPYVLAANPFLLGYYRLLLGISQKEFYSKGPFGSFMRMEEKGEIGRVLTPRLTALCTSLIQSSMALVDGLDSLSQDVIHELQLLTIGPQLRGGANTGIGQTATKDVYELIRQVAAPYIKETTERTIRLENEFGRTVLIEFFSDPDVSITEKLPSMVRLLVSIEIKGGADASNIHNRLGEAEKSHLKARKLGLAEFWTILRVPVDPVRARADSPTTTQFFYLDRMSEPGTPEYRRFSEMLGSLMGIRIV